MSRSPKLSEFHVKPHQAKDKRHGGMLRYIWSSSSWSISRIPANRSLKSGPDHTVLSRKRTVRRSIIGSWHGSRYFHHATGSLYASSKDLASYMSINRIRANLNLKKIQIKRSQLHA
ncbi:uncharacterized protein LOC133739015 isoform X1 [Rosa rugosa]|uniref:uncharacterized protein LOC133739015 isoform X1 n=1 Tax=Rosa rugosa TaxID=74645 RepID=UPI002B4044D0|nr:uncharacterized protein LOC133739015 isoform X1 [Rosa rugosa]